VTPLAALLSERIEREGPIPVADYMAAALGHPQHGYYMRRQPLGARGDFTTAPEISQMFGEIIGLWCISVWEQMGHPDPVRLIELGPGRGTLMADTLHAVRVRPAFRAAARVHLVEPSPVLRRAQEEALPDREATWHAALAEAAAGERIPLILVTNEVFDALPIHQLERTAAGWRERLVGFDAACARFGFEVATRATPASALVPAAFQDAPVGSIFEVCPAARELAGEIAAHIAAAGGAALIIDYGHAASGLGDTLQAVRRHRFHDVLADPGEADITAHLDFEAVAAAAAGAGAKTHGPVPQGLFLRRLGIEARAEVLLRAATAAQARDVPAALRRLIDPDQMGTLFKALAITHRELPAPAGFEAAA
jgi:NADH dehydrogenase [ubiquinone] 1 alpha subcomplex assembly factor 7